MNYLHKFFILVGLSALSVTSAFGQVTNPGQPQKLIRDFLYAIYQTNQDPLVIAQHYVALQEGPNDFSVTARYQGIAEHLVMLRKGQTIGQSTTNANKPVLFNPEIDSIVPYNALQSVIQPPLSLTSEQVKNTYVLIEYGKPLRYFLVHDNKIHFLYYMVKETDGHAYFLGY